MPTLFDDEDFYVPPPKKENKAKKNIRPTDKELSTAADDVEKVSGDMPVMENGPADDEEETFEPSSQAREEEASATDEKHAQHDSVTEHTDPGGPLAPGLKDLQSGISFEVPEEEGAEDSAENIIEHNMIPVPGIKDEKVDDLDKLLRTEIIAQDYAAFSALRFEPVPEEGPDDDIGAAEPEGTHIPIAALSTENLDFDLNDVHIEDSNLPEFELDDRYYTIGEVAALFAVNVSHIRFWTTEFKLKVRTTRKGDRLYNPENIARLRLIHHLVKENKYTIKGAKEQLKTQQRTVHRQVDLKEKLSGLKDKLERIKRNL